MANYEGTLQDGAVTGTQRGYYTAGLGSIQLFIKAGVTTKYLQRAYQTVLAQEVMWLSIDAPDLTGEQSPYAPGNLTGIVCLGRVA